MYVKKCLTSLKLENEDMSGDYVYQLSENLYIYIFISLYRPTVCFKDWVDHSIATLLGAHNELWIRRHIKLKLYKPK